MRVAIDYTPAIKQGAGVGRYTRSLVDALMERASDQEDLVLWASRDASGPIPGWEMVTPPPSLKRLPVPDRWLTVGWYRLHVPLNVERFLGDVDVVHGPDFVIPPTKKPAVVTIHDLSYIVAPKFAHPKLQRYLSEAVPRALRRAARVVAVSQTTANDLTEHYKVPAERISVIPNGVDPRFHKPDPDRVQRVLAQLGVRPPYFLIVGTIEPRKNHQNLLRAFEQVSAVHPEASLLIVGRPGWLSDPIIEAIDDASRRLPVRLLSLIDDDLLPALYAACAGLVYPSWYEGFGLPVVEAMASGAPVITSSQGALAEVAGDAALLAPPDDPEAIAELMCQLLDDTALREHLSARGLERAARFTWTNAADLHLKVYREVFGHNG